MKTFAARTIMLKAADNETVGGYDHNRHLQGDIFVSAKTKAAALEVLKSFGYTFSPSAVKVGMGDDMDALVRDGIIGEDYLTVYSDNGRRVGKVHFDADGKRVGETIGTVEYVRTENSLAQKFVPSS